MHHNIPLFISTRNMRQEDHLMVFDLHARDLYIYVFCLCNDPGTADKIVGIVYARLHEDLLAGRVSRLNLRPYLYKTAYHILAQKKPDSDHAVPVRPVSWKYGGESLPDTGAENRVLVETMQGALRNDLTEDQRHVVILRFIADFRLKETAAIMGKTVGNVKVIQNRAISALRQAVGHQVLDTRTITLLIREISLTSEASLPSWQTRADLSSANWRA